MLSRREFVVAGFEILGAWLVAPAVAGQIVRLAKEERKPYLVEVHDAERELWASWTEGRYVFSLDVPYGQIEVPELTWDDWLELKGADGCDPEQVRECLTRFGCYQPEGGTPYVPPNREAKVPDWLQQEYVEWEYAMYDSPTALAYQYLNNLDLANREATGAALGSLDFVEGPSIGNNESLVYARSVETLGGLQQRLIEIGELVQVREARSRRKQKKYVSEETQGHTISTTTPELLGGNKRRF